MKTNNLANNQKIEVGDTWSKGSASVVIFGYTDDFVIYRVGHKRVGWLGDYRVDTEYKFRLDYTFCYADPDRKEPRIQKMKRKYNKIIESLIIK